MSQKKSTPLLRPVKPDDKLAAVVGSQPQPRTEITKKIWDYIKANNLQDPQNKRNINADAKLKPIFKGKSQVSMFEMTKLVNEHITAGGTRGTGEGPSNAGAGSRGSAPGTHGPGEGP